jgi:thioredoxin reductase (NADPH)
MEEYEVIIIGGGPAGLTAGLYTSRAYLETALIEASIPSGQVSMAETIENYPGFPDGIAGRELIERFAEQAVKFGTNIIQYTKVDKVELQGVKKIITAGEKVFTAKAVIIASGAQWKKLGIPGEEELSNKGVSYCAICDGAFFEDLDIAVVGGSDTAIGDALYLAKMVNKVFVIHRRDELRAQKILQDRAFKNPKIEFIWSTVPREIKGQEMVESLIVENVKNSESSELPVAGVFIAVGQKPNVDYLNGLIEMNESGYIIKDENCATSVPGIFAAGDVTKKALRQISTAVGDGAIAAYGAEKYLGEQNRN